MHQGMVEIRGESFFLYLMIVLVMSPGCGHGSLDLEWIEKTVNDILRYYLKNPELKTIGSLLQYIDQSRIIRLFSDPGEGPRLRILREKTSVIIIVILCIQFINTRYTLRQNTVINIRF